MKAAAGERLTDNAEIVEHLQRARLQAFAARSRKILWGLVDDPERNAAPGKVQRQRETRGSGADYENGRMRALSHSQSVTAHPRARRERIRGVKSGGLVPTPGLGIGLDRASFAEFFFYTREQAGDWRGAGVSEVQRAVDGDCSEGLLSFDATECTWRPEALEF